MVTILKRQLANGVRYELADFADYVAQLKQRGIEPAPANYRVFVAAEDEAQLRQTAADYEQQIARFYRLSPSSDVPYEIQDRN